MDAVTFEGVTKSFGAVAALRGVSFAVREGEVFGLLGPNGAGKTTLMRILLDVIRADSGKVSVFGEPWRASCQDRIGYLPEERGLYVKQRVADVLTYFAALKGIARAEARRRAHAWLERLELPEVGSWRIERLSKGMSQKVQFAAALLPDPELCVLDEPTSGLDPVNARLVQEAIAERRARGRTTILSTHQMDQVESLCDRIAMIDRGRLVVYGAVDEVRRRHSVPEARVRAAGPLPAVEGVESAAHEGDSTWRLRLAPGARPADVLAALVRAGAAVEGFETTLMPIEEIFVRLVKENRE